MTRATASRAVIKESGKCRSGRERLRVATSRPSIRGGKTPHAFSDDEREAAEHDGDVVMPAGKAPSFVMVEAELAFQVLVDALRAIAFFHQANQFLLAYSRRQRRKRVLGRLALVVRPFDEEPQVFAVGGIPAIVVLGNDAQPGEARPERAARAVAPHDATKLLAPQLQGKLLDAERRAAPASQAVDAPHLGGGMNTDGVVEVEETDLLAEVRGIAIGGIRQDHARGQSVGLRTADHRECNIGLGTKANLIGDTRFGS